MPPLDRLPAWFNGFEVALWPALGLLLAWHVRRRPPAARRDGLMGAATLVAFGGSDWAEGRTGDRWWSPWWLLLWKAACVLTLAALLARAAFRDPARRGLAGVVTRREGRGREGRDGGVDQSHRAGKSKQKPMYPAG